ncbi:c-type cytochrome [Crenobacter caeni]|uniref:C-type cytochrome n=1 Tax=Crenobacter caeni TaxID=2705474 RepID=A0A6B2KV64_9NEIS|nr:c-type cytochrome [Crenobacter caeni]NDV14038.1 c-type cytochrome [Crenobacter caeni]
MRTLLIGLTAAALLLPSVVRAATPQEMAKQYNCLACHSTDKKLVGPSFKEISAKYKGQQVEARLVEKVKKGGAGSFGLVPMAPNAQVPDADLKAMVKWVLAM